MKCIIFLFKTQYFHDDLSFQFQWSPSQFNLIKEQIHSNWNITVSLNWFNRKYPTWQQPLNKTLQNRHLTNGRAVWQLQKKSQFNVSITLCSRNASTLIKQLMVFVHLDNCCKLFFSSLLVTQSLCLLVVFHTFFLWFCKLISNFPCSIMIGILTKVFSSVTSS